MSDVRLSHKKMINVDLSKKVRVVYPQNHSDLFGLGFDESGHIGFQREITNDDKLNADLVDDTNSSNKFTNSQEKTKLAGIESGAQANIIEQISVNGVPAQVDSNKNVNLVILLEAGVKLTYVGATGVLSLLDEDNNVLSSVDLPLELIVQSGYYDSANKNIVLVLANQDTIVIPVADILSGVATQDWVNSNYYNKVYIDNNFTNMFELTYSAIKTLKDNNNLIKGAKYRIIDYVTKTNGTINNVSGVARSMEHPFDIIVTAISNNEFSEVASAINHTGDTYFANSKLSAWKLWYCFENDNTRFEWADTSNGKGVIYRLIDEFENDLPYDFKNIQFKRYKITSTTDSRQSGLVGMYIGFDGNYNVVSDSTDYEWYYTFTKRADGTDLSLVAVENTTYQTSYFTKQVVIGQYLCDNPNYRDKQALNDIVFITTNVIVDIKIDDNSNKNTLVGNTDITYSYYSAMFRRNIIIGEQSHNRFGECFEENVLGNGTLTTSINHIRTSNHFKNNIVIAMSSCSFESQASNSVFPNLIKFCNFNGYVDTVTMNGTSWWNSTFMSIARATITLNTINYCQISGDTFTLTEGANNRTFYNLFVKGIANSTTINLDSIETALGTTIQSLSDKTISWSRGTSTNSILVNFEMRYVDTNGVVDNYTAYSKDFGVNWIKAESPYLTDLEMQDLIEEVFE